MSITATQCRGARAMLKWPRAVLAEKSGVDVNVIRNFETERHTPFDSNRRKLQRAFERAGLRFLDRDSDGGVGVRLKS